MSLRVYTYLSIGNFILSEALNGIDVFWTHLFSKDDRRICEVTDENNSTEERPFYRRKLHLCRKKLEFLGFDKDSIEEGFNEFFNEWNENMPEMQVSFNFEALNELVKHVNLYGRKLSEQIVNIVQANKKYEAFTKEVLFIERVIEYLMSDGYGYSLLMLLLINDVCTDAEVVLDYYDLVKFDLYDESEISQAFEKSMCLLITEGSSDTKILKSAFDWIHPDIADFFEFIDMEENYPFTGVGHLANFYHGILKIGSDKNIVFIFDNDTEGRKKFSECVIDKQSNLRLLVLPSLSEFDNFETLGPSGCTNENINCKAVSIEMFLDLEYRNTSSPKVRWTSYDAKSEQYQGALVDKKSYQKRFFTAYHNRDKSYSLSKLTLLLDTIINTAKELNEVWSEFHSYGF